MALDKKIPTSPEQELFDKELMELFRKHDIPMAMIAYRCGDILCFRSWAIGASNQLMAQKVTSICSEALEERQQEVNNSITEGN